MRSLPPAFVLAVIIQGLIIATRFVMLASGHPEWMGSASWALTAQGVSLATVSLLAAGAFDLARRTSSPAADAARIAGIVFTVAVGLNIAGVVVDYIQMTRDHGPIEILYHLESYAWSALMIGGIAALITAGDGWRRAPAVAGVAMVAIVISRAPPILGTPIHEALLGAVGRTGTTIALSLTWLSALGATVWLIAGMAKAEPAEDGLACERGLRRMSSALWLRVIAAGVLVMLVLFAFGSRTGSGSKLIMVVAAPAINAFALCLFGVGAFTAARSGIRDYSAFALYAAGALSVWAAGAMLAQVPWFYAVSYADGSSSFGTDYARETVQALSMVIPLVAAASVVALTIAIAGFARRRDLQELRDQASSRAGAFVVLILVSLLIAKYGLPKARSHGTLLAMSLAIGAAGLCAIATVAKLASLAAAAVAQAPGLPTAIVREPSS